MAPRYAFTFQLGDRDWLGHGSPGHAAAVISTPQQQTYSGLGPADHDWRSLKGTYSAPSFEPQVVQREETPSRSWDPYNYSTVSAHEPHATYTIPITEDQSKSALAEIQRFKDSGDWYNAWIRNYCTTDVNRNANAAGLGTVLPHEFPWSNDAYLSDVERTLRANPRAKYTIDRTGRPIAIPDTLREIQRDYAYVGGGYDTPSERLGHVPSPSGPPNPHMWRSGTAPVEFAGVDEGREPSSVNAVRRLSRRTDDQLRAPARQDGQDIGPVDSFDERFGQWTSSPRASSPRNPNLPPPAEPKRPLGLFSGKPMPLWITPPPIWGDLENPRAAVDSQSQDETTEDWLRGLLRSRDTR
ncbi:hypothetical protein ES707_00048 [subsurface metagenome]